MVAKHVPEPTHWFNAIFGIYVTTDGLSEQEQKR